MFDIRIGEEGVVYLEGRFDASEVEKAEAVFKTVSESMVADLSGLDYISSAGISVLLKAYKRLNGSGQSLTLANLSPRIRNVFQYAGLDKVFPIQ